MNLKVDYIPHVQNLKFTKFLFGSTMVKRPNGDRHFIEAHYTWGKKEDGVGSCLIAYSKKDLKLTHTIEGISEDQTYLILKEK